MPQFIVCELDCVFVHILFGLQLAHQCMREVRRAAIQAQKNCKETLPRARRLTKEMLLYWKKYEKVEKEHRKRAEKEALEQRRLDEEMKEVRTTNDIAMCVSMQTHTLNWPCGLHWPALHWIQSFWSFVPLQ